MGYFDALTAAAFDERNDGTTAFYPWGALARGYVLPGPAKRDELRAFATRFYRVFIPTAAVAGGIVGFLTPFSRDGNFGSGVLALAIFALLLLLGGALGFYAYRLRQMTRGLPRTEERGSFRGGFHKQAKAFSPAMLWALEAVALFFVALGCWIAFRGEELAWIGVLNLVVFVPCAVLFAYQLRLKARRQPD